MMAASPARYAPCPVPSSVPVELEGSPCHSSSSSAAEASPTMAVTEEELRWCFDRCPETLTAPAALTIDGELHRHYGADETAAMLAAVSGKMKGYRRLLLWPGVGTRWQQFASFLGSDRFAARPTEEVGKEDAEKDTAELRRCFVAFANDLGQVDTYRALALDRSGLEAIMAADEIFPTGQLRGATPAQLDDIIRTKGVRQVLVARLFIANLRRLLGVDPSISLHDDWQTTTVIASGYLGGPAAATAQKSVFLFCVSVPVIESCGWTLQRVAKDAPEFLGPRYADHAPWFCFKAPAAPAGVWFDATVQRTERYGLHTMPHLRQRLRRVWRFDTADEVAAAVAPFVAMQQALHDQHPQGECPDPS